MLDFFVNLINHQATEEMVYSLTLTSTIHYVKYSINTNMALGHQILILDTLLD